MAKPALGPRVLIMLDASTAWSRGVLRGFTDVGREQGWTLLHYQGYDPSADTGDYNAIPWRLGLLTEVP